MKITAQDVFTVLYEAFHKLEIIQGPDEPGLDSDEIELEVYKERIVMAQKEVEVILLQGSQLLERYIDNRIKKIITKMKYDGELK